MSEHSGRGRLRVGSTGVTRQGQGKRVAWEGKGVTWQGKGVTWQGRGRRARGGARGDTTCDR
eukprot:1564547-Rhodomonas_salina.1